MFGQFTEETRKILIKYLTIMMTNTIRPIKKMNMNINLPLF